MMPDFPGKPLREGVRGVWRAVGRPRDDPSPSTSPPTFFVSPCIRRGFGLDGVDAPGDDLSQS
jgi:hypothetical protein